MVSSIKLMSESCFSFIENEGLSALVGLIAIVLTLDSKISKGFRIFFLLSILKPYKENKKTQKIRTIQTRFKMAWNFIRVRNPTIK